MKRAMCIALVGLVVRGGTPPARYLPRLGPSPIRTEAGVRATMVLPPLEMHDSEPPADNPLPAEFVGPPLPPPKPQAALAPAPILALPPAATNAPAAAPLHREEAKPAEPSAAELLFGKNGAEPVVPPQMLVPFFQQRGGSNSQSTIVIPAGLAAPIAAPADRPSSTATYVTPKP